MYAPKYMDIYLTPSYSFESFPSMSRWLRTQIGTQLFWTVLLDVRLSSTSQRQAALRDDRCHSRSWYYLTTIRKALLLARVWLYLGKFLVNFRRWQALCIRSCHYFGSICQDKCLSPHWHCAHVPTSQPLYSVSLASSHIPLAMLRQLWAGFSPPKSITCASSFLVLVVDDLPSLQNF